ncbi:uncharacterized protein LOC143557606 [Bidens hawaiensis]|uniref:uncharacterized protein LOC143557606 n=1 Tax=Bidens hawaiensis TaxID=980011 RepID=UPI00404AB6EB
MDDSVSVTTSCLAVGEKRPRRTGGCVGIFFQLFDWNKRFSKKKLFSRRLLPPDRAKEPSKLLQIEYGNSGSFPNNNNNAGDSSTRNKDGQMPTLVARLMGLESMPSSGELTSGRRHKLGSEPGELDKKIMKPEFRPQKVQKTGISDRRTVTRFGSEALQLKNAFSRSRKHHHPRLASPVPKTNNQPKRNSSRLIGAATRVLESGLQNKSKRAITYCARNRVKGGNLDSRSKQTSCKNCGNLINVSESKSKINIGPSVLNFSYDQEQELQPRNLASPGYMMGNNRRVDDVRISSQSRVTGHTRSVTGQTQSRVSGKVEDMKLDKRGRLENGPSQWQKRPITHKGPHNEPRMVSNIQYTGKQTRSEACKPDYQGQKGNKTRCEIPARLERRKNNQHASSCNPIGLQSPFGLTGDCLGALVGEKLQELASRVGYDSRINWNQPKRMPAASFQDMLCALSVERQVTQNTMEFRPKRNRVCNHSGCRYDHNTRFCLQTKLKKAAGLIACKNSDHLSPGSVLESPFSNVSCCSSSLEDNSGLTTQHARSLTYSYEESQFQESEANPFYSDMLFSKVDTRNELALHLLTYISQVLSTIDIVHSKITRNTRAHIKYMIFNSELVLSNQMPHNSNEINSSFICDLLLDLDVLADVIRSTFGNFLGSHNKVARNQLKRFVFDAVIEYLESKYVKYSECGFRSWTSLPLFRGIDGLIDEVVSEVKGWMGLVGGTLEDLLADDMKHGLGEWIDFEVEVYETVARIESDIMQMLVDEIVVDV